MADKIYFFYCNGTAQTGIFGLLDAFGQILTNLTTPRTRKQYGVIQGIDGRTATWDADPRNDPFPSLLDPNIFKAEKIAYPAAAIPIKASMDVGVNTLVGKIQSMPKGSKFMLGGYSQGAATVSEVMLKVTRPGGSLYSYNSQFLGGVCFGNPRRQQDYRGEVGGTWSGYWDDTTGLATTGGHGSFPTSGPYARLTGCEPTRWIEFNEIDDIFSSTGDTTIGQDWTGGNDFLINLGNLFEVIEAIFDAPDLLHAFQQANAVGAQTNTFVDPTGKTFEIPGAGHTAYPVRPPPGDPANGQTSYQIALRWLTDKALESATAPIILPNSPSAPSSAGWSTVLLPPA
jgi:hypothetical protein